MQASSSSASLSCNFSFPLCVTGITRRFTLSNEIVDHDQRRRAMKRHRSLGTYSSARSFDLSGETRPRRGLQRGDDEIRVDVIGGVDDGVQSGSCCGLPCAAKAA